MIDVDWWPYFTLCSCTRLYPSDGAGNGGEILPSHEKGSLQGTARSSRAPVDALDPSFPIPPLPVYQFVNDKIYWSTNAPESPPFLIDPPRPAALAARAAPAPPPSEMPREEAPERPVRLIVPPAPQFTAPPRRSPHRPASAQGAWPGLAVYSPENAQVNRFVCAASPFNPDGPFHLPYRPC
jgi:hypothetical protein